MFSYKYINKVQIELSNRCNASCPQCVRNHYGGATVSSLPLTSWDISNIKKTFDTEFISQLQYIYLCGTYGDPLMCKDIIAICKYFKSINPRVVIGVHTNGSLRKKNEYKELAPFVDCLAFGIDGLSDTNHLYRKNTNFSKIIENAKAFIDAGGHAEWDYIVFRHNQHQVDEAQKLSKKLKFAKFNIKKTSRFFNKQHQYTESLDVQNKNGEYEYTIFPPTYKKYINQEYANLKNKSLQTYFKKTCIKCYAQKTKQIYIGAEGLVFPCGWLHDRLYGFETELHTDNNKIQKFINSIGYEKINCLHTPLKDIVDGPWFELIQQSWTNQNRLERCAMICGDNVNMIGEQNINVTYEA